MKGHLLQLNKRQEGQVLVETAFVLPILLLIIMGIIQFGLLFEADAVLNHLSREGARAAVVGKTDADVRQMITEGAESLAIEDLAVTITPTNRYTGDEVKVTVTGKVPVIVPFFDDLLGSKVDLEAKSAMRME